MSQHIQIGAYLVRKLGSCWVVQRNGRTLFWADTKAEAMECALANAVPAGRMS